MTSQGDISQVPLSSTAQQVWPGIPGDNGSVLFWNQDLNNTVYLGYQNNIAIAGLNAIPLPPNGMIPLSANRTVYAVAAGGTSPLVVMPGGTTFFRGLTQALGQLVLPAILSPNYVTGVSGWTIRKDGSAEFNNLVIRGTFIGADFIINSAGTFFYSGAPALGNLIASIASNGGTDGFGNVYQGPGFVAYSNAATWTWLGSGGIGFSDPNIAVRGSIVLDASADPTVQPGLVLGGPEGKLGALAANVVVYGTSADLSRPAQVLITAAGLVGPPVTKSLLEVAGDIALENVSAVPPVPAGGASLYAQNGRTAAQNASGQTGALTLSGVDTTVTTITIDNNITKAWEINAGDWQVNTAYRLVVWGHGTQAGTATTLTFSADINGGGSFAATQAGTGFAGGGATFKWRAEIIIICVTTGTGGTAVISLNGQIYSGTTSTNLVGEQTGIALNTTVANTFQLRATFGATASITCDGSLFERLGS